MSVEIINGWGKYSAGQVDEFRDKSPLWPRQFSIRGKHRLWIDYEEMGNPLPALFQLRNIGGARPPTPQFLHTWRQDDQIRISSLVVVDQFFPVELPVDYIHIVAVPEFHDGGPGIDRQVRLPGWLWSADLQQWNEIYIGSRREEGWRVNDGWTWNAFGNPFDLPFRPFPQLVFDFPHVYWHEYDVPPPPDDVWPPVRDEWWVTQIQGGDPRTSCPTPTS